MKQTTLARIEIVCDFREKEIIKLLKTLGSKVSVVNLPVGDFVIDDIVIERKSYEDFINSIIDKRIFYQVERMKQNYSKVILILEGFSETRINENALKGALASLLVDGKVSLVQTFNAYDTAKLLFWIAKKQSSNLQRLGFKVVNKKGKNLKEMQETIVSALPGISLKMARRLLKRFKSVRKIFLSSENELMKVKGIGEKIAKRIKEVLDSNYE